MVYIYKKKKGEVIYYYLRASIKKEGKMQTKDIAYLGSDPLVLAEKLQKIPAFYAKSIRKSYKTIEKFLKRNHLLEKIKGIKLRVDPYLGKELGEEIAACKYHFEHTFKPLDETSKEEILQKFAIEFAYSTTSLEGNTITLAEAGKLLIEERTPKNRTLREVYDVQNTSSVFTYIYEKKPAFSNEIIEEIHAKLLEKIDMRKGYRVDEIHVFKSNFSVSPGPYVRTDMGLLLDWFLGQKDTLHPVVLGALFHHKFEHIHPFMDGNGRTGRMLLNWILLSAGFPPIIIPKKDRIKYLSCLHQADDVELTSGVVDAYIPLIQFIGKVYVKKYWDIFL